MASPVQLRVVIYPETRRTWIARLLEYDLMAVGRSIELAADAVLRLALAHIEYDQRHQREPLSVFAAAPPLYWTAFKDASPLPFAATLPWSDDGRSVQVTAAVLRRHPTVLPYLPPLTRTA